MRLPRAYTTLRTQGSSGGETSRDQMRRLASGSELLLRGIQDGEPSLAYGRIRNYGHVAQQCREIEVRLAAASHKVQGILRLALVRGSGIRVQQVGQVGRGHNPARELQEPT